MKSRTARVIAAALRAWAPARSAGDTALRLEVREPERWEHTATVNLDDGHADRLLTLLRRDVAESLPRSCTPAQAAAAIEQHLVLMLAAGTHTIHAADLLDLALRTGQSKTWLASHLVQLLDAGHLREIWWRPGTYRITTPPAWAIRPGMAARTR